MLPSSSGLKYKKGGACYPLHARFLLDLFFNSENAGNMLLQNVG
jgi:hypothetical protein